ncbi:MAG: NTP transferase domain-containing protein [Kiritimatiellae bacterium]|nr:NTP transferase domain-containing protein [Kiritimatiellia bacterium]
MTAVIPAAGRGTRFLPVTKVLPKEMLPIGSRPALELVIDEARDAGAERIVVVISRGKELIREYFEGAPGVVFVYQEEQLGLGHAVLQAASAPGFPGTESGEKILVLLGDALVAGCSASREMLAVSVANGGADVIGLERVPPEKVSRYGIAELDGGRIVALVEKPAPEEAPSDLAIAGRYLLDAAIFKKLATQGPGRGGEVQLTDAIDAMLHERTVFGCVYSGRRQDIGNPRGYFKALEAMGENT